MKNTVLTVLAFITLILFSCGLSTNEKAKIEKEILDSIKKADSIANVLKFDSLKQDSIAKTMTSSENSEKTKIERGDIESNVEPVGNLYGTFKDTRDGKIYKTVKIGTQTWMAENLAYKSSNGCWAYDNIDNNITKYGYLYNWKTAKLVCPTGWHLPSDAEWSVLINYLGGEYVAGGKMKEPDIIHWASPNTDATNSSKFSGLPGGQHDGRNDVFIYGEMCGYWWSSTEYYTGLAWYRNVNNYSGCINRHSTSKEDGLSVRCVKD